YEEAIKEYEEALNLKCTDELRATIYNNIGSSFYYKGEYEEAIKKYEEALNLKCTYDLRITIYENIGNSYYEKGEYEEAIKEYKEVLKLECNDKVMTEIYNKIGNSYNNKGEYEEAIKEYKEALKLECTDQLKTIIYNNIGNSYFNNEDFKEAIREYKEALKLELTDQLKATIYNSIGNSYFLKGQYKEAIDEYQKVLKLENKEEKRVEIYNNIGNSYFNNGEYKEAINEYKEALKLKCNDELRAEVYNNIGNSYFLKGKHKEAIEVYEKSIEIFKKILKSQSLDNNQVVYFNLSQIYNLIYNIRTDDKYLNEANKYLVKANDNKFYEYIEKMNFKSDIKLKIYKLFNKVIGLRDSMIYKEDKDVGHYTKIGTLKHLVKPNIENSDINEAKLRLNNVAYMNDPTEGEVFIELLLTKVREDEKLKYAKEFIKNLYITKSDTNREILNRKSSVFLTSFSEAIDTSLPMWVQYSDDGQGCCITIKSSFFDKEEKSSLSDSFKVTKIKKSEKLVYTISKSDIGDISGLAKYYSSNNLKLLTDFSDTPYYEKSKEDECYCLYKIQYLEYNNDGYYIAEDKEERFKDLVESLCDLREDIDFNPDLKPIIQNILDQIRFLFKDKNYEHEKELRLIKFENNGKVQYTGENEGFVVPHVYIEMDKELEVEEVILGPKAKNPTEISTYLYYTDKVKQVSKSKIKYK
ncbi:tetratricopeptide repeat protein, partial [Clostridium sp. LIBA-8841]|uniref:tetratricopeptide repeat protein n=1 Tax=Clostridium sp. LIBA-8841 TaxID=2987530 RepID=UPI002AC469E5